MTGIRKGLSRVEVSLKWDPSPAGSPAHDLDLVAAVYPVEAPHGEPLQVVHYGQRSPDGTITLSRDSRTGQGFGWDEVMRLELDRLPDRAGRVVVGAVIQDRAGRVDFGAVAGVAARVAEGPEVLAEEALGRLGEATAAVLAEFTRGAGGGWELRAGVRGFAVDPEEFTRVMGAAA
ncbi:TerD family protein [Streptomyces sp. BI20]|uniref:TerD family protein n=1 Tax=Streptomyces sp. BI20 TaxID=3403460 RepID=UPI003C72288D